MNSEVSIPNTMMKKKVLLMGKNGVGKTSMRSIIFANYIGKDTKNQQATTYIDNSEDRLLGNLVLNLWDFGGQETFYENYFIRQQDKIFKNVEVLIYVFDVQSRDIEQDIHYYQNCLTALLKHSPGAKVFCLVHKMDLIPEEKRDIIFKERENYLKKLSKPLDITCFCTSIWDETLYNTWSSIVSMLVPNIKKLEKSLNQFTNLIEADEILLFERKTFLKICHCILKPHKDEQRFEKVSNILKQFKLSCKNVLGQFESIQICSSKFLAYIGVFTANTYIMVILSDPSLKMAAILINICNARKLFERLEIDNQ